MNVITVIKNGVFSEYTLELLSAHLGEKEGYLWVLYSDVVFDVEGEVICCMFFVVSYKRQT